MATGTLVRGCEWCQTCLYDGWGDWPDEQVNRFASAVVERFEKLANERFTTPAHTEQISWHPHTSEVWGQYGGQYPDDICDQLRALHDECSNYVFEHPDEFLA